MKIKSYIMSLMLIGSVLLLTSASAFEAEKEAVNRAYRTYTTCHNGPLLLEPDIFEDGSGSPWASYVRTCVTYDFGTIPPTVTTTRTIIYLY